MKYMVEEQGCYLASKEEQDKLVHTVLTEKGALNRKCVGRSAKALLEMVGVSVGDDIRCIICETDFDHPFVQHELMMPILPIVRVNDIDEAIRHINYYGSHHTDCIITEDRTAAEHFMQLVDSASCYMNCSTRFADGYRYGFGAEVGVSTGKLHARGPVGLEGLVTYKYKLFGDGHIVADYAEGRKTFHFKDL